MLVDGKTIDFKATFKADIDDSIRVITPSSASPRGIWNAGSYTAGRPGRLSLEWDNTGSIIYQKRIVLKVRRAALNQRSDTLTGDVLGSGSSDGWRVKTWPVTEQ